MKKKKQKNSHYSFWSMLYPLYPENPVGERWKSILKYLVVIKFLIARLCIPPMHVWNESITSCSEELSNDQIISIACLP